MDVGTNGKGRSFPHGPWVSSQAACCPIGQPPVEMVRPEATSSSHWCVQNYPRLFFPPPSPYTTCAHLFCERLYCTWIPRGDKWQRQHRVIGNQWTILYLTCMPGLCMRCRAKMMKKNSRNVCGLMGPSLLTFVIKGWHIKCCEETPKATCCTSSQVGLPLPYGKAIVTVQEFSPLPETKLDTLGYLKVVVWFLWFLDASGGPGHSGRHRMRTWSNYSACKV